MNTLDEIIVARCLSEWFISQQLSPLGKMRPFGHHDDVGERSFAIDLAVGPVGTPGNRSQQQIENDKLLFRSASEKIDPVIEQLTNISLFPGINLIPGHNIAPNHNPVYGIAVEIENNLSKYLLGSLLAAAITGRWGLLVLPNSAKVPKWIQTIKRMIHKGEASPIPSNILIFAWPELNAYLQHQLKLS